VSGEGSQWEGFAQPLQLNGVHRADGRGFEAWKMGSPAQVEDPGTVSRKLKKGASGEKIISAFA